jgi:hypothetical protein
VAKLLPLIKFHTRGAAGLKSGPFDQQKKRMNIERPNQ